MWWRPSRISPSRWAFTSRAFSLFGNRSVLRKNGRTRKRRLGHQRPPPQRHLDDLRRHADADWHDAATETARDDDVAFQPEVTISEPEAMLRLNCRRPAEQADLAAMGVAGQLQSDARGHPRRDIGFMREQDHRCIVADLRERSGEIVDTEARHASEAPSRQVRELIAEAGEPERAAVLGEAHGVVL